MPSKKTTMIREESSVDEENTPGAKIAVIKNDLKHVHELREARPSLQVGVA